MQATMISGIISKSCARIQEGVCAIHITKRYDSTSDWMVDNKAHNTGTF